MNILILFSSMIFCGAILLPNHYLPWLTAYQDFLTFLSLIMLGFCITLFNSSGGIKIISKVLIFITLLLSIVVVQFLMGKLYFFGDMLIVLIYLLGLFISITIGFNLVNKFGFEKNLYFFSCVFIFCSVFSVYFMLKQWLLLHNGGIWIVDLPLNGRPFANFAQPNNCATFLSMSIMATLYLYEKKYLNKISGCLLIVFLLLGLALTQSRTSWVFLFVFFIWWFWKTHYFQTRLNRWLIFFYLGIYTFFVISLPFFSNYLGVIATSDFVSRISGGYLRIPMWEQILIAIQHEPWFGYGWNQVSVAQISVYLESPTTEWIEHSHNILLDILVWNGVPLGIFIILLSSLWLYSLTRMVKNIECFTTFSMIGAVLVHSMLEYPLDYAFFLLPVGFLLGLISSEDKKIKTISVPNYSIGIVLSGALILYIWIFTEYRIIEKDVQLVRYESLNIGNLHATYDAPDIILLTQLREQVRLVRTRPVKNMTDEQLELMRKVTYRYATPIGLYRYSQALALNNKHEEAKKYLLIINGLHGRNNDFESLFKVNESLVYKWNSSSNSR